MAVFHPTQPTQTQINAGLFLTRLIVGFVMVFHGAQKLLGAFGGHGIEGMAGYLASMGFPLPTLNAYVAAITEFGGGLAIMLGLATRWVSVPLAITMAVASFTAHAGKWDIQQGGMEYAFTLMIIFISLAVTGGGQWSIAKLFNREEALVAKVS